MAAFLAAGGYHHHLGANTWESAGAPPPPEASAALRHATVILPDEPERGRILGRLDDAGIATVDHGGDPLVRDPSGNALLLALA
jgi:catechol 2,3-dioxygenase